MINRFRKPRYSLQALILLMTAAGVALFYCMEPRRKARQFVELANSQSPRASLALLPESMRRELQEYLSGKNYPDWQATVASSRWEVAKTGRCRVVVELEWATAFAAGTDLMSLDFEQQGPKKYTITNQSSLVGTVILD